MIHPSMWKAPERLDYMLFTSIWIRRILFNWRGGWSFWTGRRRIDERSLVLIARIFLAELHQQSIRAFRMDETDQLIVSAVLRLFVQEMEAKFLQALHLRADII